MLEEARIGFNRGRRGTALAMADAEFNIISVSRSSS